MDSLKGTSSDSRDRPVAIRRRSPSCFLRLKPRRPTVRARLLTTLGRALKSYCTGAKTRIAGACALGVAPPKIADQAQGTLKPFQEALHPRQGCRASGTSCSGQLSPKRCPVEMGTEEGRCGHIKDPATLTSVASRALGSDQGLVGSMDYFREDF